MAWRDRSQSFEERFDWSYRQLWLLVMRDYLHEKVVFGAWLIRHKLARPARIDEEAEAYEKCPGKHELEQVPA